MLVADTFSPELMLGAPRRSPAVPNFDGTLALYNVSTHSFGDKTRSEWRAMSIDSGSSYLLTDEEKTHDANWIPGSNEVIYLKSVDRGVTKVMVVDGSEASKGPYVAAEVKAPLSQVVVKRIEDGSVVFGAVGLRGHDGELFNDEAEEKKSTGKVYDDFNVRVWSEYVKSHQHSIWYTTLTKDDEDKWTFSTPLHDVLLGYNLEAPANYYDIGGAEGLYDIGSHGIGFVADDPEATYRGPDRHGTNAVYFVPMHDFSAACAEPPRRVILPHTASSDDDDDAPGFARNLRITADGRSVGFLWAPLEESARTSLVVASVFTMVGAEVLTRAPGDAGPLLPPNGFEFAAVDGSAVFITVEDAGRTRLSRLDLAGGAGPAAETLVRDGTVTAYFPLREGEYGRLLVTSTSIADSSLWQIIDAGLQEEPRVVSSATRHGRKYGLSHSMLSEFWFEGDDDTPVHCLVVKPADFDETKKYPWVLMPHGGPQSSWTDSWSTRWNLALMAQQGYVVILPNVAGSIGYGIDFTARIYGSWGGAPFNDILRLLDYLDNVPYLDFSRAVLAGASYGGYMVSWMLGHPVAKRFACAVWHDGIFSLPAFMLMSDRSTAEPDFGGAPYLWRPGTGELLERWNPAAPERLRLWKDAPPSLVIHSDQDFRCPLTEGLAAFKTLQAHGVTSRFLTFADEGHWVLKPENSIVWHRTVYEWMDKFAKSK